MGHRTLKLARLLKPLAFYFFLGVSSFMLLEILLRLGFGLGNPVLSQRDSVLNGGSFTDQRNIITELLKANLTNAGTSVEVLNASAGSWAIENRIAYVRAFGTFDSDAIVLQVGTSDLIQPTSTGVVVGNLDFPDRPALLAIQEGWIRYIQPRLKGVLGQRAYASTPASPLPIRRFDGSRISKTNEAARSMDSSTASAEHSSSGSLYAKQGRHLSCSQHSKIQTAIFSKA